MSARKSCSVSQECGQSFYFVFEIVHTAAKMNGKRIAFLNLINLFYSLSRATNSRSLFPSLIPLSFSIYNSISHIHTFFFIFTYFISVFSTLIYFLSFLCIALFSHSRSITVSVSIIFSLFYLLLYNSLFPFSIVPLSLFLMSINVSMSIFLFFFYFYSRFFSLSPLTFHIIPLFSALLCSLFSSFSHTLSLSLFRLLPPSLSFSSNFFITILSLPFFLSQF